MAPKQTVTDEQANEALRALTAEVRGEPVPEPAPTPEATPVEAAPAEEAPAVAEEPAAPLAEETATEVVTAEAAGADDVESLRKRLADSEAANQKQKEDYEGRLRVQGERYTQNERVLRDKHLRKSAVAADALQILRRTRSVEGAAEQDVDRVIGALERSMSGAPEPAPIYAEPPPEADDQTLILNGFLNEKSMSAAETESFARFIRIEAPTRMSPQEQALGQRDLDGFLRLAHVRWQDSVKEQSQRTTQADAVQAVKVVQNAQRQAARAATAKPAAPRKTGTPSTAPQSLTKLSPAEQHNAVSKLLRESVEENR